MIFSLLYIPFILVACYYFSVPTVGLSLIFIGFGWISFLLFTHKERKNFISPAVIGVLGIGAWISEDFMALKLYPLLLSLLFLLYFIGSVITKHYLLIAWVEKFKKRPLESLERRDVIVSHQFWIGVLGANSSLHLYFVLKDDTYLWALYSFAGWYLLFGTAMALQLLFAYRAQAAQGFRNLRGYGLLLGVILLGLIPAIVGYFLKRIMRDPKPHILFQRVAARVFRIFFRYAPGVGEIDLQMDPKFHSDRPYIFVASHESWLDYPLLGGYITDLYHITNKRTPFIGLVRPISTLLGVIDGIGINVLHVLLQKLRRGSNVLIFPEGSRSVDGRLLPFKTGVFSLAIESGVPIVPVVISGTRHLVPKGIFSWQKVKAVTIKIRILEPMEAQEGEEAQPYKQRVWEKMRENKEKVENS
ncbi:lysophospholipid acyltransferase family protein [Sulfuricurvum sp.]|uniref:lysophospholipid acyltransferase family protein n=1 Tax=Sulfuricurvum sp. TaxID=2025608 RepID=UPI003C3A13E6